MDNGTIHVYPLKRNNMSTIRITAALLLVAFGLGACKKEVTQVVNQAYSVSYTIKPTDWVVADQGYSLSVNLTVNELDNIVVSDGGVIVYLSFDNGKTFVAIPQEYNGLSYGATHQDKSLYLDFHYVDGSLNPPRPSDVVIAKVLLVDGQPLQ